MFVIQIVRCEPLPEIHNPIRGKQSTTTQSQRTKVNATKVLQLLKDVSCSHRIHQEGLDTAGNDIPTPQELPASESSTDCISCALSSFKKIKLINWLLQDSCITTANLYH